MGERQGQKVFPGGGGPGPMPMAPGADRGGMNYPGMPPMGMARNAQGMLAHQNSQMEALERRAQRDRGMSVAQVRRPPHIPKSYTHVQQRPGARVVEDDDSAGALPRIYSSILRLTYVFT